MKRIFASRPHRRRRLAVEFLEDRTLMTVAPTATTLIASATSVDYGQTVTLTAAVSSTSTPNDGTVTFLDSSTTLGNADVSGGTAELLDVKLPVGTNQITATYSGDGVNFAGSASVGVGVNSLITTIAGNGYFAYSGDNGPATAAELYNAEGVAVDSVGDVFIADSSNNRIREVNHATGVITTVAGNGTAGYSGDNGPATAAELDDPVGIVVDSAGDLFIADTQNQRIREVNYATGVITTVAGNGSIGGSGDGGPATAAEIYFPYGIAVDSAGDVFIADFENERVREVNHVTDVITTVAGYGAPGYSGDNGPATAAELNGPEGIVVDSAGDLFIADSYNHRIREVNLSTGIITTVAGDGTSGSSGDAGPATAAELDNPSGIAVDSAGDLFISDTGDNLIREVNYATGLIATLAGDGASGYSGDNGPATAAELNSPSRIALDSSGHLFIADSANNRIREVNLATGVITTVAGNGAFGSSGDNGPATAASLSFPEGIALDSAGDLFIVDTSSNQIREVNSATGVITTVAGNGFANGNGTGGSGGDNGPATAAELSEPSAVAVDASGDLFIADSGNNRIREVNHVTGIITTVAGDGIAGYSGDNGAATAAELDFPEGIAIDSAGDLFIADSVNNRIREVNHATGAIATVVGNGTGGFSGDSGPATAAELDDPTAVALDSAGDLFIGDSYNNRIREVNQATGAIVTVAGNGTSGSSGDNGPATAAQLDNPLGIALDSAGDLYIVDVSNRIREVNAISGLITTVAGNGTSGFNGDNGPATAAEISFPGAIAVDSAGNLYIADTNNQRVREVAARSPVTVTVSPEVFHAPSATGATTLENTQTSSGLVVTPNSQDTGFVTNFQITNITGGSLFLNDGVTAVTNGEFITVAQGQAGLKFTPSLNSTASGSFTVQESTSASAAGLGGTTATATITVSSMQTVHTPSVTNASTLENTQTTSGLVITPNSQDTGFVTNFQITDITGGSLFLSDGVTAITNGLFITVAQGAAGLKFTPSPNSTATGSFVVQASSSGTAAGLGGSTVTATISVTTAPTSSVSALGGRTSLTSFTVSWTGTPGSGGPAIASYNIDVSTDGGPFTAWLTHTTATSATFTATIGHTYGFTSQAIDAAGTVEPAHKTADTTITTTATPWQNPVNALDVIGSGGEIVPNDALVVIDYLNTHATDTLPTTKPAGSYYYDVLGHNDVIPDDALQIIDYLNNHAAVSPAVTSSAASAGNGAGAASASDAPLKSAVAAPASSLAPGLPLSTQGGASTVSPAVMTASLGGGSPGGGVASPSSAESGSAVVAGSLASSDKAPQSPAKSLAAVAGPLKPSGIRASAVDFLLADSTDWLHG